MDRAEAISQLAIIAINVLGAAVPLVRSFFRETGLTDAEIDAAIDAVVADAQKRMAEAKRNAGITG